MSNYGSSLRSAREGRGLSMRALADLAGVSTNTLHLLEHSKTLRGANLSTLLQVLAALGETPESFFGRLWLGPVAPELQGLRDKVARDLAKLGLDDLVRTAHLVQDRIEFTSRDSPSGSRGRRADGGKGAA